MKMRLSTLVMVLLYGLVVVGQQQSPHKAGTPSQSTDLDPLALKVLKAATEPIRTANAFSFRALISKEHMGTNGQMITLFHTSTFTVERPDKLHAELRGRGKDVQLFYKSGQSVLYTPDVKLYTALSSPKTIDATLDELEKKDVFIPVKNFLESDPYQSLTDGLQSAYVIGEVTLFDQPVHHLAFSDKDVDWQLWVVGGDEPRIRRMEIIDKSRTERPRIVIDFLDWNLNASPSADLFEFKKPAGAKEIELLKQSASSK